MKWLKVYAVLSFMTVLGLILFLFGYIFYQGMPHLSLAFLTEMPRGAVLGEEGGIMPAIIGSFYFTAVAVVLGGLTALGTALFQCFYKGHALLHQLIHGMIACMSGIPSIVLGLFSYSFLVKTLGMGRCIFASGVALGLMIMPFMEVRFEKVFHEIPKLLLQASYNMGCSIRYTIWHLVLPQSLAELLSIFILGASFAMGATAPLIFTGAVAYASVPHSIFEPAMALPMHLYLLVAQGTTSLPMAYATAAVMMLLLLTGSLLATILVHFTKKRRNAHVS